MQEFNKIIFFRTGGKPSIFPTKQKDQIFQDYLNLFEENGKVPAKSDGIWSKIKSDYKLPEAVTLASIYTAMLKKFNSLKAEKSDQTKQDTHSTQAKDDKEADKSNDSLDAGLNESNESPDKKYRQTFTIDIETSVWKRIEPRSAIYHREVENARRNIDRTYHILPPGVWTYVLSKVIANKRKDIPCRWGFKRAKVYENGINYIELTAKCVTCKARLKGTLKNKPETPLKRIRFMFTVSKIDEKLHQENIFQKNVRIGGEEGRSLSEQKGPATLVRRDLLSQSIEMFQTTPARIPTANAIRCTRHNVKKQERIDSCPIKALEILKQSFYDKWIRSIGSDPFFCTYVNTDQIILYKVYKKKNQFTKISCDATGSIAHKLSK